MPVAATEILGKGTATCACNCSETASPDCTTGKVSTSYSGGNASCGAAGLALDFTNGGCVTLNGALDNYYASTRFSRADERAR